MTETRKKVERSEKVLEPGGQQAQAAQAPRPGSRLGTWQERLQEEQAHKSGRL